MNPDINHNSSSYQSASTYIKHTGNLGDKLERTLSIHSELVEVLMSHGCSECIAILRDVVRKHNNTEIGHESYTHPTLDGSKQPVRKPGTPKMKRAV
jgi:hypothetical protein